MIKKYLIMVLFLSLSLFLIMPVHAADPGTFTKETDIYPNDLDYRNSLVDWNGYNMEIDIIKDTAGGLDPQITQVVLRINGSDVYTLSTWDKLYPSDPQDYQYKLRMTSQQKTDFLKLLFDRKAENMNVVSALQNYVFVYTRNNPNNLNAFALYFRIYFTSLLNINFQSFYISDSLSQNYTGVLSTFNKGIMFKDVNGDLIENITVDTQATQPVNTSTGLTPTVMQRANYNFTNRITNIKSIDLVYQISANAYDPRPQLAYYINEIGFFASAQVILPDLDVDTDFQIYAPTICGSFDFGCVARNLIGEFSNNIYKRLGAEDLASGVMGIYDTIFYPVYIIDNTAWQNGILSIYAIISLGVLYLIVKRVLQ